MSGRSGQEATFCSYGFVLTVSAGGAGRNILFYGVYPCTMEARKATKETKGPCTMEKALCSFVPWKPQRPNARVRWKRLCSFVLTGSTVYRQCTSIYSNIFFFFSHIHKACGTRWYLSTARMASVPSNGEDPATRPSRAAGRRRGSGAWRRAQCRRDPVAGSAHHGPAALGGREPRKIRGAGAGEARVRVVRRAAWHLALEVRRRRAARRAAASANLLRPSAHLACVFPNEEWGSQESPNKESARTRERAHDCAYSRSGALGACLRICTRSGHVAAAHALGVVWRNVLQCWLRMGRGEGAQTELSVRHAPGARSELERR